MANKDRKTLLSHLLVLMQHVFKWKNEPEKRSNSWTTTISRTRDDIRKTQKRKPSLTNDFIRENWNEVQKKALREAEKEMQKSADERNLTWYEVFTRKYMLVVLLLAGITMVFCFLG